MGKSKNLNAKPKQAKSDYFYKIDPRHLNKL